MATYDGPKKAPKFKPGQQVIATRPILDHVGLAPLFTPGTALMVLDARSAVTMVRTQADRDLLTKERQYHYLVQDSRGETTWCSAKSIALLRSRPEKA